jgi:branched-chain amino acid transport system substrate-binding protein
MTLSIFGKWAARFAAVGAASLAFGACAVAAGTVNVGMSTTMSGAIGSLGVPGKDGVQMAIDKINAEGGLLGDQIKLLTAEDQAKPPQGATNVRNFILNDKVKAIFGPVSSAVASAEAGVATQYKVPIFFHASNDIDMTGHSFSKYVFQVVPSNYMESQAIADYVAKESKKNGWKTFYTISPDYSFGRNIVGDFLKAMKTRGVDVDLVGQQWPALGTSDFSQYISAIITKKPDFIFIGQYGGDLVTFTKQANGAGLFKNSHAYAAYWLDSLEALGPDAPGGVISVDRVKPFHDAPTKELQAFTKTYHAKFCHYPPPWAVLGYSAVEAWAQGVKKAGSFDAGKVVAALSGDTIHSALRGAFKIRECDHLAEAPEYMGVLSKEVDKNYGFRVLTDITELPASEIMMSCEAKKKLQPAGS